MATTGSLPPMGRRHTTEVSVVRLFRRLFRAVLIAFFLRISSGTKFRRSFKPRPYHCACCERQAGERTQERRLLAVVLAGALVGALALLYGCGPVPAPRPPQPRWTLTVETEPGASVRILDGPNALTRGQADASGRVMLANLQQSGFTACAAAEGFRENCAGITLTSSQEIALPLAPDVPAARRGVVRADRFVWQDAQGPHLFLGTSLFWALWGELHDRERLNQNLAIAQAAGVDYLRVFAQVGGGSWSNRGVGPKDAGWAAGIASLTDKAYDRYGLRVQWTVFAWANGLTKTERAAALEQLLNAIDGRQHKVAALEISNEGDGNGPLPEEARALAARAHARFPGLVAITAPAGDSCAKQAPWYRGSVATLVTLHLDRSISGAGGRWRPVRQPWRESTFSCPGQPQAYSSNEPIGPKSSVADDDDPLRLTMNAVVTWLSGIGAYVFHTDAGIRGGGTEDLARGRVANLWQVSHWTETTAALRTARALLPPDLPNWSRGTSTPSMFKVEAFDGPTCQAKGNCSIDRLYCATNGGRFVCAGFNLRKTTALTAVRAMSVRVLHPLTGAVLQEHELGAGAKVTLGADPAAVVLAGTFR